AEDTQLSDSVSCSDVDGDALTYSVVGGVDHGTLNLTASTGAFTYNPAANYNGADSFTFKATDGTVDSNTASYAISVTPVNDAPVVTENQSSAETVDYSDAITSVTFTARDVDSSALTASVQWRRNGGAWSAGLPTGLSLGSATCGTVSGARECTWTLSGTALVYAATYDVRVSVSDGSASGYGDASFNVTQEDARVEYTGGASAVIGQPIALRATVWDSAAVGYASAGQESGPSATIGDITKMWIRFQVFAFSGTACSTTATQTTWAQVSDTGTAGDGIGTASSSYTYTGSSDAMFCVTASIVAGNNSSAANVWYAGPPAPQAFLAFYQPSGQYVTGGGWVADSASSNGKANFGFNARMAKTGKPQGQMVFVWRGLYSGPCTIGGVAQTCSNVPADFVIKSNALTSLAFANAQTAALEGKASIQVNRTSDGAALYGDGGATFRATVTDGGTGANAAADTFSLMVYDKNGVPYKSTGTRALGGGNVVVHASN
ncbi:MAG: cadherin-like domain-containing protein, partial [Chloroflexota bacterium]|nr:cadherin-like domain-containing protein [Chloroflexota bacterium]